MVMRGRYVAFLAFLACLGAGVACNAVLGIDSATLDPTVGAGADGGGGTPASTACTDYCTTVQKNCTGPYQEYIDLGTCTAMCQNFEPGTAGDTSQDSRSCRAHFASAAASDPVTNCRSAGPLGGSCGNAPCTSFCTLEQTFCADIAPYPSEVSCVTACQGFKYLLDAGDIALSAGDTLNCRIYHLESAYEPANNKARATHCPHTAVASAACFNVATDAGTDAGTGADASDAASD